MSRSQGNGRSVFLNFRRAREIHRQTDEFVGQFKGILLKYIYCCKYVELFVVRRTAKSVCSLKIPHIAMTFRRVAWRKWLNNALRRYVVLAGDFSFAEFSDL